MTERQALENCFTSPAEYARLTAYVRRRGVREDPEDVVQQAICDALAVEAVPTEREEVPRWFHAIVSRRVVDRFRRQKRFRPTELEDIPYHADFDGRDLLGRIDHELDDDGQRKTLGWMLREHAGESLKEIAHELSIDAPALRQRICRLRRELRSKYLVGFSSVLLLIGFGAGLYWQLQSDPNTTTKHHQETATLATTEERDQTTGTAKTDPATAVDVLDGEYTLIDASLSDFRRMHLRVSLHQGRAAITDERGAIARTQLVVERINDTTLAIRRGSAQWMVSVQKLDGERVRLSGTRGYVVLRRNGR